LGGCFSLGKNSEVAQILGLYYLGFIYIVMTATHTYDIIALLQMEMLISHHIYFRIWGLNPCTYIHASIYSKRKFKLYPHFFILIYPNLKIPLSMYWT
jgi:hypothetical protein